ncbi:MAG: hypothetical protein GF398_08630 [Chitinivibrionales bacterium]|nr:hypothetical protein [Chitinivibrionales bacterium]
MNRTNLLILNALPILLLFGCGANEINKGDTFVVIDEFRQEASIEWAEPYSEGFSALIPTGTVLEVIYKPGTSHMDVKITVLDGNQDQQHLEEKIVPDFIRNRPGFEGFYFSIPKNYVGTKIEKK